MFNLINVSDFANGYPSDVGLIGKLFLLCILIILWFAALMCMRNVCGVYHFVIDVCGTVVTMYEGGVEDVDCVYGKTLCIKLQDNFT